MNRLTDAEQSRLNEAYLYAFALEALSLFAFTLLNDRPILLVALPALLCAQVAWQQYRDLKDYEFDMGLHAAAFAAYAGVALIVAHALFGNSFVAQNTVCAIAAVFIVLAGALTQDAHDGPSISAAAELSHSRFLWRVAALAPLTIIAALYAPVDLRWQFVAAAINAKLILFFMIRKSWLDTDEGSCPGVVSSK